METKANYVLIGAFTIAGFLGVLGFLLWFSNLQLNRQFAHYDVYFPEVTGLSVSSQVLFAGLDVGKVVDMQLAPDNSASVRVRLELNEDTPVRTDSQASVESSAVTGVSTVSITPGIGTTPLLSQTSQDPVPVIRTGRSTLQTLGEQMPQLLNRLNLLAEEVTSLLNEENRTRVSNILANVESASGNLDKTMADVSRATDAVASAADDLAGFGGQLKELGDSADGALRRFSAAAGQAETALAEVNRYVAADLTPMTNQLQQAAGTLQDDLSWIRDRGAPTLDRLDAALDSATRTLDAGGEIIHEFRPVASALHTTLGRLDEALADLPGDLPIITSRLREAATAAASAFDSLRAMLDSARGPVQAFTRDALPQYGRIPHELRALLENANQLVTNLKRNPGQILRGQSTPEFRR